MLLFFSDLDGTILDEQYRFDGAIHGINEIRRAKAELIPVSAKTFDEIRLFSSQLEMNQPFVFENGGGVAIPVSNTESTSSYSIELQGAGLLSLTLLFEELQRLSHLTLVPIALMSDREIASCTGLPLSSAASAKKRMATVPFHVTGDEYLLSVDPISSFLAKNSLKIEKGRSLFYLQNSSADKGSGVKKILQYYEGKYPLRKIVSTAIGDAFNDASMFKAVDNAFCVDIRLKELMAIPGLIFTGKKGQAGFNEAVAQVIKKEKQYA